MLKEKEKELERIVRAYDELVVYNRRNGVKSGDYIGDAENWHGVLSGVYKDNTGLAEAILHDALYQWFCDADEYYDDSAVAALPVLTMNAENRASSGVGLDAWMLFKGILEASIGESLKYNLY